MTPTFPSEVPTPGRWIRSDRTSARGTRPRVLRLVDLSSQTPSGGGQRADPVQKHDPGERMSSQVKKGIDKPRPVTEADVSSKGFVAFMMRWMARPSLHRKSDRWQHPTTCQYFSNTAST